MEEHLKSAGYRCQSCTQPNSLDEKWVTCAKCRLLEHVRCAGVDNSVKDQTYVCKECNKKDSSTSSRHLTHPPSDARSLRSTTAKSKQFQKNPDPQPTPSVVLSTTSSARAARLRTEMQLIEEEQLMKEQELKAKEAIEKKATEEALRRLEEKKALMEEEARIRQRQLDEEKAIHEKQQLIRKESLEKKQSIVRQLSECGSRGGSIHDSQEKVTDWLDKCPSEARDLDPVSGKLVPLPRPNPPPPIAEEPERDERRVNRWLCPILRSHLVNRRICRIFRCYLFNRRLCLILRCHLVS